MLNKKEWVNFFLIPFSRKKNTESALVLLWVNQNLPLPFLRLITSQTPNLNPIDWGTSIPQRYTFCHVLQVLSSIISIFQDFVNQFAPNKFI